MTFIFALFILIIAILILWQQQALFTLIPATNKNKKFIGNYAYLLIFTSIFGFIFGFFSNNTLDLLYVGIVLVLSGFFTASFAKRMKK